MQEIKQLMYYGYFLIFNILNPIPGGFYKSVRRIFIPGPIPEDRKRKEQ